MMADSDAPAAVCDVPLDLCAAAHDHLKVMGEVMKKLTAKLSKLKKARIDENKPQDVKTSQISFDRACAVQKCRLLSLPPEIRNMIWKLCLFHPNDLAAKLGDRMKVAKRYECITMTIDTGCGEARPKLREAYEASIAKRTRRYIKELSLRNLAVMETCQTIYNEAAPFLWSQRFYFHSIMHLQAFLLSNARLDLVRDIFVWTLDRQCGVNYMPAICALLADKVKGLERFDVDMNSMDKDGTGPDLTNEEEIHAAGVKLGFDVYSCMYPWVTKVVRDQGIERLMTILQIPRETFKEGTERKDLRTYWRTHLVFSFGAGLSATQRKIADNATAEEIVRLVDLYDK